MNKFDNLLKKLEVTDLLKESLNTFTYNLPENRRKRLFDFYTFASLDPLVKGIQSSDITVRKKLGEGDQPDIIRTYGSRKLNTNFIDSFWKSLDKCYIELAKEIMDDIFFCIAAEFKHVDQDPTYTKVEEKIPEYLNRELYKNYIDNNYDDMMVPPKKGEEDNSNYSSRYQKTIKVIAKSNASKLDFVKLCSYVYDNFSFHGAYAGPKWADAANAFLEILEALPKKYRPESIINPLKSGSSEDTTTSDEDKAVTSSEDAEDTEVSSSYGLTDKERLKLFIAIDHTWGLSHNTGPTFNKLLSFKKLSSDGGARWLQPALDKRTQDENLFRFINTQDQNKSDVSEQMVPIIKRVVYSYYGATNENELYDHVNKTNPVKEVPLHVSDVVYRIVKHDVLSIFRYEYEILNQIFKSHYNHWCSYELKLKNKKDGSIFYVAYQFTDSSVEACISDDKNYSFNREGIDVSREYINSRAGYKSGDTDTLRNASKGVSKIILDRYKKFEGPKIDINKTSLYNHLDENSKENLKTVNLGEDTTLLKVIQFCDDLKSRIPSIDVKIKDNEIEVNNKTTTISFIGVEKTEEAPEQISKSSPDAEDYFAGKRKKTSIKQKENPIVRFSFTANKDIGRNFTLVDEDKLDVYKFIINCISDFNIDENGNVLDSNELKSLKSNLIKQFDLSPINTTTITNFPSSGGNLIIYIPPKYRPLFKTIKDSNSNDTTLFGNSNNNYVLKIRAEIDRMTNPYSIDLMKDNKSILNKTFRYPSLTDIQNNFKSILDDIINDVIDSEKENIKKSLEESHKTQESHSGSKNLIQNLIERIKIKLKQATGNDDISYYLSKLNLILGKGFGKYEKFFETQRFEVVKASKDETFLRVSLRYYLSDDRFIRFIIAVSNSSIHKSVFEVLEDLDELFTKQHSDFIGVDFSDELNKVYSDLGIISKEKEDQKEEDIYDTPKRVEKLVEKIQDKLQEDGFDGDITSYNIKLKTILNKLFSGFEAVVKDENFQVITASYTNDYLILNLRYHTGTSTGTSHLSFIIEVSKGYNMDSKIVIFDDNYKTLFNKSHKDFIGVNISGDLKTVYTGAGIISKKEKSDTQSINDTKESKATKANFLIDKIKNSLEVENLSPTYSIRLKLVLYKIFEGFESVLLDKNFIQVSAEEITYKKRGTTLFVSFEYIINEDVDTTIGFSIDIPLKLDFPSSLEILNIQGETVLKQKSLNFLNVNIYDQLKKIYIDAGILSKKEEPKKEEPKKVRTPKSPELLNLLNNISVKAKADIATSGLSKFMMPFLTDFLNIIKPYGNKLTYTVYSNYNKAPDKTESISVVINNTAVKGKNINLKMFFVYNKDKPEKNKVTLYEDPQDKKNTPNPLKPFADYLADEMKGTDTLQDSVNTNKLIRDLLKSFLLRG